MEPLWCRLPSLTSGQHFCLDSNTSSTPPHLFHQIQADPDSATSPSLLYTLLSSCPVSPKQCRNDIVDRTMNLYSSHQMGSNVIYSLARNTEQQSPHTSPSSCRPLPHCPSMGLSDHPWSLSWGHWCYNLAWALSEQPPHETSVTFVLTLSVPCWWEPTLWVALWLCTTLNQGDLTGHAFLLLLVNFLSSLIDGSTDNHQDLVMSPSVHP